MDASELLAEILEDTRELVKRAANPRRGTIALSPETAAMYAREVSHPVEDADDAEPLEVPVSSGLHASPDSGLTLAEISAITGLTELRKVVSACQKCALCETRTQTVFSDGNASSGVVFVGEAPGADEDRTGVPFVGRAGQLLTDIIVKGMRLRREDVYICNVVKCRPPNNRDPLPREKELCVAYLARQLELVKPKVICALGKHAANTLLRKDEATGRLRGKWHFYNGIPLRVTYHPAYLLRTPGDKKLVWDDIQHVMRVLSGEENPVDGQATGASAGPALFSE
ncbi:MAG TPA: uracil-DNA glycosylase [Candidatus Hydrogenedentes bacterium]|nr:uracil-DNA glycosylase [Candidatus Hydrogenedentota bacterium]